jgi:hypothetical protein
MDWMELIKNISIIIASWTAVYGIDQWRREYRGKRQAELAEEVLSLFYEAQDAIGHIRNPFAFGGEGASRKAGENETPEEKDAFDKAFVIFERFKSHQGLFNKIHAIRYRFMAQFGVDSAKPFDNLRNITNEIQVSAQALAQLWARQNRYFRTGQQEQHHFDQIQKHEAVFWEGLEDSDPISPKLKQCVAEIETTCRGILSAKGTLYSVLNYEFPRKHRKKNNHSQQSAAPDCQ